MTYCGEYRSLKLKGSKTTSWRSNICGLCCMWNGSTGLTSLGRPGVITVWAVNFYLIAWLSPSIKPRLTLDVSDAMTHHRFFFSEEIA